MAVLLILPSILWIEHYRFISSLQDSEDRPPKLTQSLNDHTLYQHGPRLGEVPGRGPCGDGHPRHSHISRSIRDGAILDICTHRMSSRLASAYRWSAGCSAMIGSEPPRNAPTRCASQRRRPPLQPANQFTPRSCLACQNSSTGRRLEAHRRAQRSGSIEPSLQSGNDACRPDTHAGASPRAPLTAGSFVHQWRFAIRSSSLRGASSRRPECGAGSARRCPSRSGFAMHQIRSIGTV